MGKATKEKGYEEADVYDSEGNVTQGLGVVLMVLLVTEVSAGGTGNIALGLSSLILLPIEIIAIVFFFISANDIKKAYPTMKEDAKAARLEYQELRRSK